MSYRLEYHAAASAQIPGLPETAYVGLVEALVAIVRDPYGASRPESPAEPEYRWASFASYGLVSVYINDQARTIYVHDITWAG